MLPASTASSWRESTVSGRSSWRGIGRSRSALTVSHPTSIEELQERLAAGLYFAERSLATSIFLALRLGKPLFLEGEAGVGKTEVAKALSTLLDARLIRLQCYEGLDVPTAVYEWDYSRQMLQIRLLEATGVNDLEQARHSLFTPEFLLERPLLQAVRSVDPSPPVLLIDELDRADEEFEAFLLELLSDFQITVPELGTIRASSPPVVVLTSNRTREIHDALRRRCLYHWIEYPDADKEYRIVRSKAPGAAERLSRQVVDFVQALRREDLYKRPGVAETLDWANALAALDQTALTPENVSDTLGVLLKYQDDVEQVRGEGIEEILARVAS
ncbi:MAG: MoxR family ATPase [bacterium]|nr:MoxR family ATPase [bacterium]